VAAAPETQYAQAGDVNIGYQVLGDGPVDLLWVGGLWSNIEVLWEEPGWSAFMRRLAGFARLMHFDRRGCGVSDRGGLMVTPTLEERVEDALAVLDAAGSERTDLFGFSEGGVVAAMLAATHPDRVRRVILYGTMARLVQDAEHPWGWATQERITAFAEAVGRGWGLRSAAGERVAVWNPSMVGDEQFADWLARWCRQALSRRDVVPFLKATEAVDLTEVFPAVRVPTLVLHRRDDVLVPISHGRWIARQVPDARLVELPGVDHHPFVGDAEGVAAEVEAFLVGPGATAARDRRLLTLIVTNPADTSPAATSLADAARHELLTAHDRDLDAHLARFHGRRVKQLGEGCLVIFDAPARAIRCAIGIIDAAARLGLQLRVGVHCGECDLIGDDVQGIAVRVATRVAELAAPGQVLASGTVRDLVAGSGIRFGQVRDLELDALPSRRDVFPVITGGLTPDEVRRLAGEQTNVLRCDGDYWTAAYNGHVATLRDSKGLQDLARLLTTPHHEIHVLDLVAEKLPPTDTTTPQAAQQAGLHVDQGAGEPLMDRTATRAYRQRITELEQVIAEAEDMHDTEAATRARVEHDALVDQLTAAHGLGGRPRRAPNHVERARKAVSRRVKATLSRIADTHPVLGRHLRAAVHTGTFCSYQPDHEMHWTVTGS
jgi:pimeloyl-ACP methyl ester carboxylesterase